jgi:GT2 family glycosyltransferase
MSDEVTRILSENAARTTQHQDDLFLLAEEDFNEQGYLEVYPDVAQNVERGVFPSGYLHYKNFGRFEGRIAPPHAVSLQNRVIFSDQGDRVATSNSTAYRTNIEGLLICPLGGIMLVGWADDSQDPIDHIVIDGGHWQIRLAANAIIRVRRPDVEEVLRDGILHSYGFIAFHFEDVASSIGGLCTIAISSRRVTIKPIAIQARIFDDLGFREVVLSHLAEAKFLSNYQFEAVSNISRGFGQGVVALNRLITKRVVASPYVERFGSNSRSIKGSIIVCIYGRAEYLFLQAALFSNLPGIQDYEFIYVSNSPELAETLLREAKSCADIYCHKITVVLLKGNAGFGAANNAAVAVAQSSRILTVNPDVFPYDSSWAIKHLELIEALPKEQTTLFGVPLYYDDGSLMHGGMYFELDTGVLLDRRGSQRLNLVRVEHYGKGAPPSVSSFTASRPVPAISGAFISSDRKWYERLGGFTEDFVFGHYEDADLCLKSLMSDQFPWMHDLRLWHLEGKGSIRRPVHEGGSLINRWLFSSKWSYLIEGGMLGREANLEAVRALVAINRPGDLSEGSIKDITGVSPDSRQNISPDRSRNQTPPRDRPRATQARYKLKPPQHEKKL